GTATEPRCEQPPREKGPGLKRGRNLTPTADPKACTGERGGPVLGYRPLSAERRETSAPSPWKGLGGSGGAPDVGWGAVRPTGAAPGIRGAPASLGAAGGAGPGPLAKFEEREMASLGRPKLCWGPGSSLWPAAPPPRIPSASLLHPAFGGSGRGGGRPGGGRDGNLVSGKAAGAWGREGNPSQRKGWLPKDALSRGTQGHTGPQRRVQVFTEGRARGAAARTGAGANRGGKERRAAGRGGSAERGEAAESGGQDAEAAGTRAAAEAATGDTSGRRVRPRTRGSRHRPWAGDGLAPRGRGKGDGQASVWGPCQQLRFSGAASRGARGPPERKAGQAQKGGCARHDSYLGVREGVDKADFMGELVKEAAELQEVMQMENAEKHLGKKLHWTVVVCILKRNTKRLRTGTL
ncbi:unnamed protein product, partial [Rangifer tarandus platyrhynchus]